MSLITWKVEIIPLSRVAQRIWWTQGNQHENGSPKFFFFLLNLGSGREGLMDSCLTGVFWKTWICMTSIAIMFWCFYRMKRDGIVHFLFRWNICWCWSSKHLYSNKKTFLPELLCLILSILLNIQNTCATKCVCRAIGYKDTRNKEIRIQKNKDIRIQETGKEVYSHVLLWIAAIKIHSCWLPRCFLCLVLCNMHQNILYDCSFQ